MKFHTRLRGTIRARALADPVPAGGGKSTAEKTSPAAAAADAGLVFYNYGGHRLALRKLFPARTAKN